MAGVEPEHGHRHLPMQCVRHDADGCDDNDDDDDDSGSEPDWQSRLDEELEKGDYKIKANNFKIRLPLCPDGMPTAASMQLTNRPLQTCIYTCAYRINIDCLVSRWHNRSVSNFLNQACPFNRTS